MEPQQGVRRPRPRPARSRSPVGRRTHRGESVNDGSEPTFAERAATRVANCLQRAGLHRLVYSRPVRAVAKRFLLRSPGSAAQIRVIVSGAGKGLKLRVAADTPAAYWMGTHEPHMQALLRDE